MRRFAAFFSLWGCLLTTGAGAQTPKAEQVPKSSAPVQAPTQAAQASTPSPAAASIDTTLQERKFRAFFDHLDADKNGVISWSEILGPVEKTRKELGWTTTDPRLIMFMQFAKGGWDSCLQTSDLDKSGTVSYNEYILFFFKTAFEGVVNGKPPAWTVMAGNGITPTEYAVYLRSIGSDADPKAAYAKLDVNNDGKITMQELNKLAWEWMGSNDPNAPGNYLMTGGKF